jgi:hypothetical protein
MGRQSKFLISACAILGLTTPAGFAQNPSTNVAGEWKIESQGPVPVCTFTQSGSDLAGQCVGPQAKGQIAGTVIGKEVRWRWQWVTYVSNKSGVFDFVGTVGISNTIVGTVQRQETGLSLSFTGKKAEQRITSVQQQSLSQFVDNFNKRNGTSYTGSMPPGQARRPATAWQTSIPAGTTAGMPGGQPQKQPQTNWIVKQGSGLPDYNSAEAGSANGMTLSEAVASGNIEQQANLLFPWASQGAQRTQYIVGQMNLAAERQNEIEVAKNQHIYVTTETSSGADMSDTRDESVIVKYRGPINLQPFACRPVTRSSFIQQVCYDRSNEYMIPSVKLPQVPSNFPGGGKRCLPRYSPERVPTAWGAST